jgi:adenylate kinase family enzyme
MRLLITGASGSGTSTLSAELARALGVACLQTDDYYWLPSAQPFTEKRAPQERRSMLLGDLRSVPHAVLGGSIIGWGSELEDSFDLIVFLIVPAAVRVERLRRRELALLGHADPAFLEWAAQYDSGTLPGRSRSRHEQWLAQRTCPIVRIEGDVPLAVSSAHALAAVRRLSTTQ